ncbi:S-adenosyl-L-methionine-dependent methyltransferase [Paraphaeosphaeria sporulosa]|uniref:S-adenosyl-L-methionine-dependent methyltransferase n=1 Tax=Paraphaeosphaeria sporulosa TaxID=1460663 RepID=A0A177C5J1_9PLEO|nr:S-adenosyl-L-methionine-dependent methyltransferase [Paraphaeosphaeria sporulosa]OAG02038.1 S-adenosyl-L-methionine-dependent methyltransferase [Paraphaeosphaeria sporulosa]
MSDLTESSQQVNNQRFNAEAAQWDANKKHAEGVTKAFDAIQRYIPAFADGTSKALDVLEIGCGTGLLSFLLAPHVRSLVGVDTADAMVDAFNAKTAALPDPCAANLAAVNVQVHSADDVHLQGAAAALALDRGESGEDLPYRFDLVVSHLTLHHIPELGDLLRTLRDCLRPGGLLALTDYEDFGEDAVAFHPASKRAGVERHGIRKREMEDVIDGVGFNEVRVERAFSLRKEVETEGREGTREMDFPFLICLAKK